MRSQKFLARLTAITLSAGISAIAVPSLNSAAIASGRPAVTLTGFVSGSSAVPVAARNKAVRFISQNRNYKTATCIGYADRAGSTPVNLRLAVARANAVCALIVNKKTKSVGRLTKVNSGGPLRTVEIVLSKPKRGGGGGTPSSCEDVDPWPDFESQNWVLYADQSMYAGDEWITSTYVSGDWGTVIRQKFDIADSSNWPSEISGECVVSSDYYLEHSPDSGTSWNLFDNSYLQTIKPGGSTETYENYAFVTSPTRFPDSYFTDSRFHWTVTTEFQTWDYYSYLTDRVGVWVDVDYDAITPAGATTVIVQYINPAGSQEDAYVTPGTPLQLVVKRDTDIWIVAPDDASVDYTMVATEGAALIENEQSTGVGGFTGWTTGNGIGWKYSVDAESVYNLTSAAD
jgi:hypothetical protein